jgi:ribosomal-protein-alanine N-acetyltransferase
MSDAYATVPSPPSLATRIVTDRLVLRPPRPTDVPAIRHHMRENAEHLRPWSPAPLPGVDPTSLTAVSRSVLQRRREWKRGEAFALFLALREREDVVVGRIGLGGVLRGVFQNAYLGYWIDRELQGRGLMTEAVHAATTFALEALGLHRVQAAVMPRNAASLRVLDKVGYRREGLALKYLCIAGAWEDHVIFAVTAEEWARARATVASPKVTIECNG